MPRAPFLVALGGAVYLGCGARASEPPSSAETPRSEEAPLAPSPASTSSAAPKSVESGPSQVQAIIATLKPHGAAFRACYEKEVLAKDPKGTGSVALVFRIDRTGSVSSVRSDPEYARAVRESLRDPGFLQCLYAVGQNVAFPEMSETTTVVYPIVFVPKSAKP